MHDESHRAIVQNFFLIITEQGNNHLVACGNPDAIIESGPIGDKIIDRIPLDITIAEFAELHNKALTYDLRYDKLSDKIMLIPKNQAESTQ